MEILGIVLGFCLCIGSVVSYVPQFIKIVQSKSVESISEPSLILMNIGMMCLCMNICIEYWNFFFCTDFECFSNLFPFLNVTISWLMVLIYYSIFITFKIKKTEKRVISALSYAFTYCIFAILVVALALGEKLENSNGFFSIYSKVLGISSAIANGLVYLPQIYILYKSEKNGSISILMYLLQTPGNVVVIIFQILFHASVYTWITYLVVLVEQMIILSLLLYNLKVEREQIKLKQFAENFQSEE